jgi:hypothetical protein
MVIEQQPKKRELTPSARCAKAIRIELKAKYPQIKFTIRSKNFAGGNSVDIDWIDGPARKDVEEIVGKYQYGHFDGMIDCYEMSNVRKDIPQAQFVMTQRNYSDAAKKIISDIIAKEWNTSNMSPYDIERLNWRLSCEHTFDPEPESTPVPERKILIVE